MGLTAALPGAAWAGSSGATAGSKPASAPFAPLTPPAQGSIAVAFVLSNDAVVIDFAGPWEVFENVSVPGRGPGPVFRPYIVAETAAPIEATGGMMLVPNFTFATAPPPQLVVIPAQGTPSEAMIAWIREAAKSADLTMSVCTGAFVLARTGLLSGKAATTHHGAYTQFAMRFPDIRLKRGARYVEAGKFASSGGLSSGIDLALRVVERYFGQAVAAGTADNLEYQGQGWLSPDSNIAYAKRRRSTASHPLCPVCDMDVGTDVAKATALVSVYRSKTWYFCMEEHKKMFDADPARFSAG
jgi:transcriptional regulator GlxA family with amidase domain/YHS domain-containing protein